ncbi:organic solute transporter subunit alpha-like [Lytechinus variegatus]|uniref:organic solute transporter subunit alpha-like n=1 Tax=Lytechinus variegatus TaxID=7654 RepID=UPI001BB24B3E|nr:organic solute transporter subunit alpha-like [Lytechinus variegatus]
MADNCSYTPLAKEMLDNLLEENPKMLPILITCTLITAIEAILFFEAWMWVLQHIPYSDRRTSIVWIIGIYPVFCATCLLGLYIPRAAGLCTLTGTAFFAVCLYEFITLIVDYFGGLDAMITRMDGTKFSIARPPLMCLFQCLPKVKMTRRNYRILEACVLQTAIIRPVMLFITEVLNIDGSIDENPSIASTIMLTLNCITLVSAIFAVSALIVLFSASKNFLKPYRIRIKFLCVQTALILSNVQSVLLVILTRFDVVQCNKPFNTPDRGYQWHCFLLTLESGIMFIPTLIIFRTTNGNVTRMRVRPSTFSGMMPSDGKPNEQEPLIHPKDRSKSFGAVKEL